MKNLIKSIDYNRELENPYINIELNDVLKAGFGDNFEKTEFCY